MNVILAGGTGFVGCHLKNHLSKIGHKVTVVSRQAKGQPHTITWKEIENNGLPECDVVVNVSGENIFKPFFVKPYNEKYKNDIISSRTGCNNLINKAIRKSTFKPPKLFISASAVGIYASPVEQTFNETSELPKDYRDTFLYKMLIDWEESAYKMKVDYNCRVACMRLGLVLGLDGGLLQTLRLQYFFGAGGVQGDGSHPFPWIHIEDTVKAFEHVMSTESIEGPVNAVAPNSIKDTNSTFNTLMGEVMKRPTFVRTPKCAFDFMMGKERSELMFCKSVIEPKVLCETGFDFRYKTLGTCLINLFGKENVY